MNTSARMLRLLSLLQTHRYWPGARALRPARGQRPHAAPRRRPAARARLHRRRGPRRRRRLPAAGRRLAAAAAARGRGGGRDRGRAAVPPRPARSPAWRRPSVQALTKVIALMPPRLRRQMDALRSQTERLRRGAAARPSTPTRADHAGPGLPRRRAGHTSATPPGTPSRPTAGSSRTGWSRSAGAGTSSPTTATARTGARFRVDRISEPRTTGQRFRPRELPAEDALSLRAGRASAGCPSGTPSACASATAPEVVAARGRPLGHGRAGRGRLRAGDERRLPRLADDGAGPPRGRLRGGVVPRSSPSC